MTRFVYNLVNCGGIGLVAGTLVVWVGMVWNVLELICGEAPRVVRQRRGTETKESGARCA